MSTARTVRPGWSAVVVSLAVIAGCSGDDGDDSAPTSTPTTSDRLAVLPAEADPGRGFLLLGDELLVLTVSACAFEPSTDATTGVTTELRAEASDGDGRPVDVVRSSFTADVPTVTDTISVSDDTGVVLESSRADVDGQQRDLRDPNPVGRLLDVDAETGTIGAAGVFGPFGGRADDPANVDGELLLRCPEG